MHPLLPRAAGGVLEPQPQHLNPTPTLKPVSAAALKAVQAARRAAELAAVAVAARLAVETAASVGMRWLWQRVARLQHPRTKLTD